MLLPYSRSATGFTPEFFHATIPGTVQYVENFFGEDRLSATPSTGALIAGSGPGGGGGSGGLLVPGNHSEIHEVYYTNLIDSPAWNSPLAETWTVEIPWSPRPVQLNDASPLDLQIADIFDNGNIVVTEVENALSVEMTTSSPAEFWFFVDEAVFADYLVFEFWIDGEALDGVLSVYFNDRRLWYMLSELMDGEFDLAYVPLFEILGQEGRFSFVFDSPEAGETAIVRNIQLTNIQFSAIETSEPWLLLLWILAMFYMLIRRGGWSYESVRYSG